MQMTLIHTVLNCSDNTNYDGIVFQQLSDPVCNTAFTNIRNNNNNNNMVICEAHKVSSNAESDAPAVARWQHW